MPKSKNRRKSGQKPGKGQSTGSAAPTPAVASAAGSDGAAAPSVGPVKYVGQVRQEARKVVWPGWPEVWKTTILVMLMVVLMGAFFFVVDWALANIVQFILGFGA
jgi:preprotein translocase subunit SecE